MMRWVHAALVICAGLVGVAAQAGPAEGDMRLRVLACTACHGKEGRATPGAYFPRIAGKPAGYLYHQLLNFRDGRRSYPPMAHLLDYLTDDYLREIAGYFAALELPYAPAVPAPAPQSQLERGRQLVRHGDEGRKIPACSQCHGDAMTGVAPFVPGLLGLSRDYVSSQLGAWQTGQRRAQAPDCMARIARLLSVDDVSAIAAWLSAQPVSGQGKPANAFKGEPPMECGGVPMSQAAGPVSGGAGR